MILVKYFQALIFLVYITSETLRFSLKSNPFPSDKNPILKTDVSINLFLKCFPANWYRISIDRMMWNFAICDKLMVLSSQRRSIQSLRL